MHLSPLVGATLENHFAYLEPLSTCNLDLKVNSIRDVGSQLSQVMWKNKQKKKTVNAWYLVENKVEQWGNSVELDPQQQHHHRKERPGGGNWK